MRSVLWVFLCTLFLIGCGGEEDEGEFLPVFPDPTGNEAIASAEGDDNSGAAASEATDEAEAPEEESFLICADGSFGCQNGVLYVCESDQWVEQEVCEIPTDCNPTEGNCGGCTPDCTGKTCGDDGCGNSCGKCDPGATCDNGTCQINEIIAGEGGEEGSESNGESATEGGAEESGGGDLADVECNPQGTGKVVGQYAKNVAWKDSNGDWLELHNLCGSKFILLIATAEW